MAAAAIATQMIVTRRDANTFGPSQMAAAVSATTEMIASGLTGGAFCAATGMSAPPTIGTAWPGIAAPTRATVVIHHAGR